MSLSLKQFRLEGCLSYFLIDVETKKALLVDPHLDLFDAYREYVAENGLEVAWVVDTHLHADHYSASHLARVSFGAVVAMSQHTASARATHKLKRGDVLPVGHLQVEALETPGHTPDSICLHVAGGPRGPGLLFTGDLLFIGSTGRTDFGGSDPALEWSSLHTILARLPGDTIVLPGHDYSDLLFSTLAVERATNPHLLIADVKDFVRIKAAESIQHESDVVRARLEFNRLAEPPANPPREVGRHAATACGVQRPDTQASASINVEKYAQKLEKRDPPGAAFIDVREPEEYRDGHMPNARNIPLSELGLHLAELGGAGRVYFSCLSGRRSLMAARTLSYLGHKDTVNVTGGFKAWTAAGLPVEK